MAGSKSLRPADDNVLTSTQGPISSFMTHHARPTQKQTRKHKRSRAETSTGVIRTRAEQMSTFCTTEIFNVANSLAASKHKLALVNAKQVGFSHSLFYRRMDQRLPTGCASSHICTRGNSHKRCITYSTQTRLILCVNYLQPVNSRLHSRWGIKDERRKRKANRKCYGVFHKKFGTML